MVVLLLTEITRKKGDDAGEPIERAIVVNMEAVAFIRFNEMLAEETPILSPDEKVRRIECSQLVLRTGGDLAIKELPEEIAAIHRAALQQMAWLQQRSSPNV